jgi:hypothetical protein
MYRRHFQLRNSFANVQSLSSQWIKTQMLSIFRKDNLNTITSRDFSIVETESTTRYTVAHNF